MTSYEVNFDGIVGPTHNYSGLSYGNVASINYQQSVSNPKQAALQGLNKMKFLADLGIKQAVVPPQHRPHIATLRALGFTGSDQDIIRRAFKESPSLFFSCCSASSMWTANAATVSPSSDNADGRVHITPANLSNKFHRSIEASETAHFLKSIFPDGKHFVHHSALLAGNGLADEGAANHTRFCKTFGEGGVQLFVFGRYALGTAATESPLKYPARHTFEASQTIARLHQLRREMTVFAQQNPLAIDAGVFHNDVISVGHENLFFYHELAFVNTDAVVEEICEKMESHCNTKMTLIKVSAKQVPLEDAVKSYMFNSQIVSSPDQKKVLIAPTECQNVPSVKAFFDTMPIDQIHYLNLRESMQNGGGPACLRLRVVLNEKELAATHQHIFLTDALYKRLTDWVQRHYRDSLRPEDLADPQLYMESENAMSDLKHILKLQ